MEEAGSGDARPWQAMRESGFRILFVGVFSLAIAFIIYSRLTVPSSEAGASAMAPQQLTNIAHAVLAITAAATASAVYGAYRIFRAEQARATAGLGNSNDSLFGFIASAFSDKKYWKIMAASALAYGVFFGFLSQILVYRADVSFTEKGIAVPSAEVISCCGSPGYVPMLTAYFTDHFLVLVIPVNVILATIVSIMVGFNVALSTYTYNLKKSMQARTSVIGGIGAASGLFMGCPTCAGSLISALLGVGVAAGGGASTSALAPFQTVFIAAGIPALALAPFLIARSIRSISTSSCKLT